MQSEHRTLDPEEADYFYMPVYTSCFLGIYGYVDHPWWVKVKVHPTYLCILTIAGGRCAQCGDCVHQAMKMKVTHVTCGRYYGPTIKCVEEDGTQKCSTGGTHCRFAGRAPVPTAKAVRLVQGITLQGNEDA